MRLFPAPPEIDELTGFGEGDLFGRKEFGDRLTRLVLALEHPAVLLLDAPWGAGKTIFVKMWEGELRKRPIPVPVIHFDAFASDYMADPFTALAGEVLDLAKRHESDEAKIEAFRKKSLGVVKVLARHGLRIGIRVATQGLVDIGDTTDAKADEKAIVDGVTDAADALLLKRLEDHAAERETFAAFREALKELSVSLGPAELPEGERRPPLVFVIDELDRCRPTFALSLLETVKHFFDVDGVVFLLVTNLAQLEKSVEFAYGAGIDARGYLEKFFHLRTLLPVNQDAAPPNEAYIAHLFKALPEQFLQGQTARLVSFATSLAKRYQFSLRKIERAMAYLNIFSVSANNMHTDFPTEIFIALCFMKAGSPEDYEITRSTDNSGHFLEKWGLPNRNINQYPSMLEIYTNYYLNYTLSQDLMRDINNRIARTDYYQNNRENYVKLWCSHIDGFALPDLVR